MPELSHQGSFINITTKILPLQFLLLFFKTTVSIDGVETVVPWGQSQYSVLPGEHEVEVSFRYFFSRKMGSKKVTVDIGEGESVSLRYRPPFFVTMAGTITVQ